MIARPLSLAETVRPTVLRDEYRGPQRITDASGSDWGLHRAGYRVQSGGNVGDRSVRDGAQIDCELMYADYLTDKDSEFRAAPAAWWDSALLSSTGAGAHDVPDESEVAVGTVCTSEMKFFPYDFGSPGTMQWYPPAGRMVCIPTRRAAGDADQQLVLPPSTTIVGPNLAAEQETDDDQMYPPRRKKQKFDPQGREAGYEEIEEDDERDDDVALGRAFESGAVEGAYNQTSTHIKSQLRRSVPDRLQRDHAARMKQIAPQLRQYGNFADRIAAQQQSREKIMDAEYSKYEERLREAFRNK